MDTEHIRNFCILAHIDHGKSTLADRMLELTQSVEKRKMREQYLDMHPLEREKGITIKMQPVRMRWKTSAGNEYTLNLIDTPGHVDFTYEVSRALAAVEGAILLVDASQGVQAQTLANLHLAQRENITIVPAINKIDLPSADIERTEEELVSLLNVAPRDILRISAKSGQGVEELLTAVVAHVKSPSVHQDKKEANPLRALIFDSKYDPYQGVIAHIRVVDGLLSPGDRIRFLATGIQTDTLDVGVFLPDRASRPCLGVGEIGYVATGIKELAAVRVGDTIVHTGTSPEPLPGYKEPMPMIFTSLFPEDQDDYDDLRDALKKLKLEDAAISFEPEESSAFGRGFRAGFLGMLHMEIISERIRREYGLTLVFSNPSVAFRVKAHRFPPEIASDMNGYAFIYSAAKMPPMHEIEAIEEPLVMVEIITPSEYMGALTTAIHEREGTIFETHTLSGARLTIHFEAPLREIIVDFYDDLKSISHGFASMSYERRGYRAADLVRLDILVAGEYVPTLAEIVPRGKAHAIGRSRLVKLKSLLPKQLFTVALQAEVEGRIIARESISAMRKDVTGYLYGGDRTRKMKLWKKQQRGKKRLKESAHVEIPPDVFVNLFKK